jgi:hypothetical protein
MDGHKTKSLSQLDVCFPPFPTNYIPKSSTPDFFFVVAGSKMGWKKMTILQQCNFLHCCFCPDEVDRKQIMQRYFADKESARLLASTSSGQRKKKNAKKNTVA